MPGLDSYYAGLAKNNRDQDGLSNAPAGGGSFTPAPTSGMTPAAPGYTQAQAGGSPYDAGSGFVNLSHLLSLNGASGQASANSAAQSLAKQGRQAQGAITSATDKYNQAVAGAQVNSDQYTHGDGSTPASKHQFHVGGGVGAPGNSQIDQVKSALDKANAGYQGPTSLDSQAGYANLSKQVSDASNRAQNATTGYGEAAQIAQDTGLSPRQAAASAFYQGVTNQGLAKAGNQYKGLGDMLSKADAESVKTADLARQETQQSQGALNDYYNQLKNPKPDFQQQIDMTTPDPSSYPWVSHDRRNHPDDLVDYDPNDPDLYESRQDQEINLRKRNPNWG